MVSKAINVPLRLFEFFMALLVMALVGDMISDATQGNTSIVNYAMVCAVFAMLSLFYLLPAAFVDSIGMPIVAIALDLLNTLFWFCGAVALAAILEVHSCSDRAYLRSNKVTNGTTPDNQQSRCREAQASCAFLFFGFFAFAVSTVFSGLSARGGARPGVNPFMNRK